MFSKFSALIAFGLSITWAPTLVLAADDDADVPELLGTWTNTDSKTQSYGRIDLVDEDGTIFMELWVIQGGGLSKEPVAKIEMPIDAESLRVPPLVGVSGTKDYGFKETTYTLKRKGKELQLTAEAFFTDGTDRDYKLIERFEKATRESVSSSR